MKMQEEQMELTQLTFENEDILQEIQNLEKEIEKQSTPSLQSIKTEDLTCLDKIRELGEEEIYLKTQLNELEHKEAFLSDKICKFLKSSDNCPKVCNCENEKCSKKSLFKKEGENVSKKKNCFGSIKCIGEFQISKPCICRKIGNAKEFDRSGCQAKCGKENFFRTRMCCTNFSYRYGIKKQIDRYNFRIYDENWNF